MPGILHIYSYAIMVGKSLVKTSHSLKELVTFYWGVEANSDDLICRIERIISRFASIGFLQKSSLFAFLWR